MHKINTDVLVIGAGAAGIRAALAASETGVDVLVVTKGAVAKSGSTFSPISKGWGMQALIGNERTEKTLEIFYNEIVRVGLGKCDPKLVRILVEESGPRFDDLLSYGIRFKRDTQSNFIRVRGCFSNIERAFVTEDFQNLKQTFSAMLKASNINIIQGHAVDLITDDNTCWGAWILKEDENVLQINAKATIISTGGGAGIFKDHLVSDEETGDGYALAHRAGANLANLEFIQFMLGLKAGNSRMFLPLSKLLKPHGICDSRGNDLTIKHIPDPEKRSIVINKRQRHFPFSCRDTSCLLDIAVAQEQRLGKKVYCKPETKEIKAKVIHYAHAFNGGLVINDKAETTVSGLFAAGEVAAGPHGADRIGGCMMTATQVFGERAGRFAALHTKRIRRIPDTKETPHVIELVENQHTNSQIDDGLVELSKEIRNIFSRNMMTLRDKDGLNTCLHEIKKTEYRLDRIEVRNRLDYFKLKNMLLTMQLIATSALNRKESLGSHYRTDSEP